MELIKNKIYRVKVVDEKLPDFFNKTIKVKFTGFLFRSIINESKWLWLDQCEVIEEVSR